MRGELDEVLARMARREELSRRRVTPAFQDGAGSVSGAGSASSAGSASTAGSASGAGPVSGAGSVAGGGGGRHADTRRSIGRSRAADLGADRPTVSTARRSAIDELVEAARRVVGQHPGMVVNLRVDHGPSSDALLVDWADGVVSVRVVPTAGATPAWPLSVKTVPDPVATGPASDAASRLAELIRHDPSLLDAPNES